MKCPRCQTTLDGSYVVDKVYGCPKCRSIGSIDLWNSLDIAVDALNAITATPLNSRVIHDVANKALEQINNKE